MVGESKILTVSYGTFSCTLEGFDEPFSTMKAIAEYFRDLAADDRFFGAEPPQPDTEMLHQIAERTIQRRVAAELAENGVILRQTDGADAAPAQPAPALAVEMPQAPAAPEAPAPAVADTKIPADVPAAPQPTPARAADISTPSEGGGDTVAEKLQRIRAVVAREAATAAYSEDQHATAFAPVMEPAEDTLEEDATGAFFDSTAAGFETEAPADVVAEDDVAEDTAPQIDTAEDDRAVEPEVEVEADPEDTAEPVAEDAQEPADEAEEAPIAAEAEDAPADEATAEAELEAETPEIEASEADNATDQDAAELEAEAEVEVEAETVSESETEAAAETGADTEGDADEDMIAATPDSEAAALNEAPTLRTKPRRRIVVQKISRADMEAAQAAKEAELPPDLEAQLMAELAEVEAENQTEAPAMEDVSDEAPEAPVEAEIEAEAEEMPVEAAQDEGSTPDQSDTDADDILARLNGSLDEDTPAQYVAADSDLQVDAAEASEDTSDVLKGLLDSQSDAAQADEAEAGEVEQTEATVSETFFATTPETDAEAEAETEGEVEAEADADTAIEAETEAEAAPLRQTLAAEAEDEAIERLMSTTNSRLDHDESSIRRASIAHLKAAVAATKADASIAEAADKREEEEMDQYRDDLARVVKPSRPRASSGRGERPSPLVLVSEQRIDRPEEAPQEAAAASLDVRPRRVTAGNLALQDEEEYETEENVFDEAEGQITYPEFAAKAGALELPDLLEAAAAHYMVVEGAEHFTRPMLMRKLATIQGPDAPSREDGLRAFGSLLRTGKIVKTDNGKFVLAPGSRFVDEAH